MLVPRGSLKSAAILVEHTFDEVFLAELFVHVEFVQLSLFRGNGRSWAWWRLEGTDELFELRVVLG